MKLRNIIFILLFILSLFAAAKADDISFTASVDKDKVTVDDRIVLTYTITGVQNPKMPDLPKIEGFNVVSSGTSSQFNIINGNMFASKSFNFVLIPKSAGKFTIGSAVFSYEGKEYKSNPVEVEVAAGGQAPAAPPPSEQQREIELGDRLFIDVKVDKDEVYVNEQVTMTFRFYRCDLSIDDLQYNPPATKNFIEESIGKQRNYREVINNAVYDVIELKTALFPVSSGEMEITPAKLKCSILVRSQRRRPKRESPFGDLFGDSFFDDPFFDRYVKYPVELESKSIKIKVKPVPETNRPSDFKGAVGDFDMEVSLKPEKVKAGEPITMTMKVSGEGNISGISAPEITDLKDFKTYEPESKVNLAKKGEKVYGEKIFEKILVPEKAGRQIIPNVTFSFFDPSSAAFKTVQRGPFTVEVEPAPAGGVIHAFEPPGAGAVSPGKKEVKILKQDILFIKTSPGRVTAKGERLINSPLFLLINVVPLLLFLSVFFIERRKEKFRTDIGFARKKQAFKAASAALRGARGLIKEGSEKDFYGQVYRAFSDYLGNKLNIPSGGITAQIVSELLEPRGLDKKLTEEISRVFSECDSAQFALAKYDSRKMGEFLRSVENLIKSLEKAL